MDPADLLRVSRLAPDEGLPARRPPDGARGRPPPSDLPEALEVPPQLRLEPRFAESRPASQIRLLESELAQEPPRKQRNPAARQDGARRRQHLYLLRRSDFRGHGRLRQALLRADPRHVGFRQSGAIRHFAARNAERKLSRLRARQSRLQCSPNTVAFQQALDKLPNSATDSQFDTGKKYF